jgi:hypothetical protein
MDTRKIAKIKIPTNKTIYPPKLFTVITVLNYPERKIELG